MQTKMTTSATVENAYYRLKQVMQNDEKYTR